MTTTGMTAAAPTAHETLRKADLDTIVGLLESQRLRTVDLSIQGRNLWVAAGNLIVQGLDAYLDETGFSDVNGQYAFGEVGLESLAARLDLPRNHLKDWRANKTDLFDTVAGYYLRGELNGEPSPYTAPDGRVHTVRLLRADSSEANEVDGMVRAVLGGSYMAIDSIDALGSIMQGMYDAGIRPDSGAKIEADLTESRMVVKVWVPSIRALTPDLLNGYTSPFSGLSGSDLPVVFAGLVFSNSEVGRGAWSVAPRIVYEVCSNGTTITKDAFSRRHVGEKLDEGVIKWSRATQIKNLELIKSQTADAVRTYLDADYLRTKLAEIATQAAVKVTAAPEEIITKVTRHTGHQNARPSILAAYMQGGQNTAGGVMQAYTAAAQMTRSGDLAFDLEGRAMDAMAWVASHAG